MSVSSQVAQWGKNSPVTQETWVPSLGREDPLEEEMATLSSILALEKSWIEEPGGLQSMALQESDQTEQITLSVHSDHYYYYYYYFLSGRQGQSMRLLIVSHWPELSLTSSRSLPWRTEVTFVG